MSKKIFFIIIIGMVIILAALNYSYTKFLKEEITDPMLKKIKESGKIIIGTDATYPPMESIDEKGNFVGVDMDIAQEIAKDLRVKAEFQNIRWEEIFDTLREGKVDMIISAITITPERVEIMAFSNPYFNAGQVIVTKAEKVGIIKGVEDLRGKTVGVQIETTSEQEAKKYTDLSLVKSFENYNLAKESLLEGEIEAIIIDYPAAIGIIAKEKDLEIIGEPFTQEFYGIAVQIGQRSLLDRINKTIRNLKETGELQKIEKRWLIR